MYVDRSLAYRFETADAWRAMQYAQAQSILHPGSGNIVEEFAGGYLVYASPGAPVNRSYALGFKHSINHGDLMTVARFFRKNEADPRVDLCPLADPSLIRELRRRHYRLEAFYQVLCHPLDQPLSGVSNPEVHVAPAGKEDLKLWLQTVGEGFSGQENPPAETLDTLAPTLHSPKSSLFLAYIGGEPAGGGAFLVQDGIAELGAGSTRPAFRRRGVQAALIRARLAAAREMGCDLAMVVTTPGSDSQRNLQRLGFELAYTKAVMVLERRRRPGMQFS